MFKGLFILFYFLIVTAPSWAQTAGPLAKSNRRSYYTYVYRVTGQEAQAIYQRGPRVVNASYWHTPVDSFTVSSNYNKTLPQGHYLFLHANGPDLVYKLHTYSAVAIKILPVKPALAILVHDSLGTIITDADVRLNSRKILYDPLTQTYRLKQAPQAGLLTVTRHGFTRYEKLSQAESYARTRTLVSKVMYLPPFRYIWRPIYSVYSSIRGHYPEGWVRRVFSLFDPQYRWEHTAAYQGYLVTNKPMYQPGDTVRYKAFVTNKKGKAIKQKAELRLSDYQKLAKNLGEVKPYKPGAYEGYFVLTDSLNLDLDRAHTLTFFKKGKPKKLYSSNSFKYEDYELKENEYTLNLNDDEHATGRENSLKVRGTNASGLNLLDARVKVTIITNQVNRTEEPEVFIPDTLWVHQQPLDAIGETTILIPDKIFPKASLNYTVMATFRNTNNERSTLTKNARYEYTKGNLKISLLQDSLLVQYLEAGLEKPKAARVVAYNPDDDKIAALPVQLPTRLPLNAYAASYAVVADSNSRADLYLSKADALVTLQTSRVNDSVFFALQNPRCLPYWYFVYRGEKLIARGQGKAANFYFQQPAPGAKPYFVAVRYLWAGEMQQIEEAIPLAKHLLSLNLETPPVVYPGQAANLKVTVKNAAGKPASGVDVTAYAITSKFKEQNIPTIPSWDRYKKQKPYHRLVKAKKEVSGEKLLDWHY